MSAAATIAPADVLPLEGDPCTNCRGGVCCGGCDADLECEDCWCDECEAPVRLAHEGGGCCPVAGPANDEWLNAESWTPRQGALR